MKHVALVVLVVALVILAAACLPPPRPAPPASASPSPIWIPNTPVPTATLTPELSAAPAASGTCEDTAPFSAGCLDQPRPAVLSDKVRFVGSIPETPIVAAAWSPDRTRLAYAVHDRGEGTAQGVEIRGHPDYDLQAHWDIPNPLALTWTPAGNAVIFTFDRGDFTSIGIAYPGDAEWIDLLPGEAAVLNVNQTKGFVDWLDDETLAFWAGCGTGCTSLLSLNVVTGALRFLVNTPDAADAPYGRTFATTYHLSTNASWLAATDWGQGLPAALLLPWPGPADPIRLSNALSGRPTAAGSWMDHVLAFIAYPPGSPDEWTEPVRPELYFWDGTDNGVRKMVDGAFGVSFAPAGDRLAVYFTGEPTPTKAGTIEVHGSVPHLGLLTWPEGYLVARTPLSESDMTAHQLFQSGYLPPPDWSPGGALSFRREDGQMAWMTREGETHTLLSDGSVEWVGWGSDTLIALIVDGELWLVEVGGS